MLNKWWLVILLVYPSGVCNAELFWENTDVAISAKYDDASVIAEYRFINKGAETIEIDGVHPDCGCVSYIVNEIKTYAPGQRGVIRLKFDLKNHSGLQQRSAGVFASDGSITKLDLKVLVPDPVSIAPKTLSWAKGALPDAKRVYITFDKGFPGWISDVTASNAAFLCELHKAKEGDVFQVVVTPKNTNEQTSALIVAVANFKNGEIKHIQLNAQTGVR